MKEESNEEQFPSVELAYPIAVASYDVALKRLDTMDGRLQTIVAFAVSVFGGFVSFASSSKVAFSSCWFVIATILCAAAAGYGIYGRLSGDVRILKPSNLCKDWLSDDKWTFQKDLIYGAAKAFDENMTLVTRKWQISVCVTILLVCEVAALTVWVLVARP
jgi:hypothetical protein